MNEYRRSLIDRKNAIWAAMQATQGAARGENRDMTAEELEAWNRGEADLGRVEELLAQEDSSRALEARMTEVRGNARVLDPVLAGGGRGNGDGRRSQVAEYDRAFSQWLRVGDVRLPAESRSILERGMHILDGDEAGALDGEEARALSAGTGSAGGYTVPTGFANTIVETITLHNAVRRAVALCGGSPLTTADGTGLPFATNDDTATTGELLAENGEASEGDPTFGQKTLNAYIYSSKMVKLSLALLQDNGVNLDDYVARMLGQRVGRIQNTHFTTGDDSGKPNGIVTASSVGKTAAATGAITFDELIDLQDSVDEAYRLGMCAWMMKQSTLTAVRKLKDGDSQYIWRPGGTAGQPDTLLNYPYVTNPDMAALGASAKTVVFGDFSKYQIRQVGDILVLQARERYIEKLQVAFLAFQRADADLLDTAAVKVLQQAAS